MSSWKRYCFVGTVIVAAASMYFMITGGDLESTTPPEPPNDSKRTGLETSNTDSGADASSPLATQNSRLKSTALDSQEVSKSKLHWDQSLGPMDILERLTDEGRLQKSGIADWQHSWLSACEDVFLSNQNQEKAPSVPNTYSNDKDFQAVCIDVLPTDLDLTNLADMHALSSTLSDLAFERAVHSTASDLSSIKNNFSRDRFIDESRRILKTSIDIYEIQSTIEQLYSQNELWVQEVDFLVRHTSSTIVPQLARDIATIWFCYRIGGCVGKDHPLVLKRCFISKLACNRPNDINDAIFQVTPPIVYDALRAMESELWRYVVHDSDT